MPISSMKTQATRKKVLTVRSGMGVNAPSEGEPSPPAPSTLPPAPGMVPQKSGASYTVAAILALIALGCFLALLALQLLEWDYMKDAFPVTPTVASTR